MTLQAFADITEQVRQSSDIVDVVSAYVSLHRAGRNFKGLCPFHSEKTPSFHVHPEKQIFRCFGCGAGGDVFKFIQMRENVGFAEARAVLASRAGIALEVERSATGGVPAKMDLERLNRWASKWFQQQLSTPTGEAARKYIDSRGISPESVDLFAIGFAPDDWQSLVASAARQSIPSELLLAAGLVRRREEGGIYDAFRNRLIFPIRDAMDRVIGFGGRTLGDDPAKYINSPQSALFDKSRCLYGLDRAKDAFRDQRVAIVVEGYIDCLMAHQFGFPHTVATLGTALTSEHVHVLQRYVDRVVLLFDSDVAGQRAADQSLSLFLGAALDVRIAYVREGKDPADLLVSQGSEALTETLTSAVSALEFKWRQVVRQWGNPAAGPARRRAIDEFFDIIARAADFGAFDPIQRGLALNQVGKLLGLSSEEVHRQLRITARRVRPAAAPALPGAAIPVDSIAFGAEARAMKELMEVILNEPRFFADAAAEFDPSVFPDDDHRQIAAAVADWAPRNAALPELISRFESVEIGRLITQLQSAGEARGNFAATFEGARNGLRRLVERRKIEQSVASLKEKNTGDQPVSLEEISAGPQLVSPDARDASLLRLVHEQARKMSHFAPRKHLATPVTAGAGLRGTLDAPR